MADITLNDLFRVFRSQESGGRSSAVSPQGARGSLQITKPLFKAYAKPGEDFANPLDVEIVAERALSDTFQRQGGDPSRTAVEWFSGAGNVAPAGSASPYRSDRADALNKRVSGYVEDIRRRFGQAAMRITDKTSDEWEVVGNANGETKPFSEESDWELAGNESTGRADSGDWELVQPLKSDLKTGDIIPWSNIAEPALEKSVTMKFGAGVLPWAKFLTDRVFRDEERNPAGGVPNMPMSILRKR